MELDDPVAFLLAEIAAAYTLLLYYIESAEGHEYHDPQVGDEVNLRTFFVLY